MPRRDLEEGSRAAARAVRLERVGRGGDAELVGELVEELELHAGAVVTDGDIGIGARSARAGDAADGASAREQEVRQIDAVVAYHARHRAREACCGAEYQLVDV